MGGEKGPLKKQKKLSVAREEKSDDPLRSVAINNPSYPLTALALEKERETEKLAKAEAERQAAEKKKKKPIRYPTEDLDVTSEKEKKAGMKV